MQKIGTLEKNYSAFVREFLSGDSENFPQGLPICHSIIAIVHYHIIILGIQLIEKLEPIIIPDIATESTSDTAGSLRSLAVYVSQFYIISPGILIDIIVKPYG